MFDGVFLCVFCVCIGTFQWWDARPADWIFVDHVQGRASSDHVAHVEPLVMCRCRVLLAVGSSFIRCFYDIQREMSGPNPNGYCSTYCTCQLQQVKSSTHASSDETALSRHHSEGRWFALGELSVEEKFRKFRIFKSSNKICRFIEMVGENSEWFATISGKICPFLTTWKSKISWYSRLLVRTLSNPSSIGY